MLQPKTLTTALAPVLSEDALSATKELFSHPPGFRTKPMQASLISVRKAVQAAIEREAAVDTGPGHERCLAANASANSGHTHAIPHANER
ncbi:MAG TPA: hypothetical protein VF490_02670 [Chryseosolibacter sp.]